MAIIMNSNVKNSISEYREACSKMHLAKSWDSDLIVTCVKQIYSAYGIPCTIRGPFVGGELRLSSSPREGEACVPLPEELKQLFSGVEWRCGAAKYGYHTGNFPSWCYISERSMHALLMTVSV